MSAFHSWCAVLLVCGSAGVFAVVFVWAALFLAARADRRMQNFGKGGK